MSSTISTPSSQWIPGFPSLQWNHGSLSFFQSNPESLLSPVGPESGEGRRRDEGRDGRVQKDHAFQWAGLSPVDIRYFHDFFRCDFPLTPVEGHVLGPNRLPPSGLKFPEPRPFPLSRQKSSWIKFPPLCPDKESIGSGRLGGGGFGSRSLTDTSRPSTIIPFTLHKQSPAPGVDGSTSSSP